MSFAYNLYKMLKDLYFLKYWLSWVLYMSGIIKYQIDFIDTKYIKC